MNERLFTEIAFALYGFSNLCFLTSLRSRHESSVSWGKTLALLGLILGLGALGSKALSSHQFPILDARAALDSLAILILAAFFVLEWKRTLPGLGFFATGLAFLFTLLALAYPPHANPGNATSAALEVHVGAIILSFGILALAFCTSLTYLVQDFMLHRKRLDMLSRRLPPLDTLDAITNALAAIGFVALSVGILFGSIWAERQWGRWWSWDPKLISAVLTWIVYAVYIYVRTLSGWKGRRSIVLIVIGFVLILVTFLGTNLFPGVHRFV